VLALFLRHDLLSETEGVMAQFNSGKTGKAGMCAKRNVSRLFDNNIHRLTFNIHQRIDFNGGLMLIW